LIEDIVENACNIAESANEFEEIKRCAEEDSFKDDKGKAINRRRN
jgi:hypothetical protein